MVAQLALLLAAVAAAVADLAGAPAGVALAVMYARVAGHAEGTPLGALAAAAALLAAAPRGDVAEGALSAPARGALARLLTATAAAAAATTAATTTSRLRRPRPRCGGSFFPRRRLRGGSSWRRSQVGRISRMPLRTAVSAAAAAAARYLSDIEPSDANCRSLLAEHHTWRIHPTGL